MDESFRKQAREIICGKTDHFWVCVLPLQTRDATREVLYQCTTCEERSWRTLSEDGFKRLLEDNAAGKLKSISEIISKIRRKVSST